jgi:hypothetical protein
MTAPVERRHRELAYKAVEGCDYCGACPDGRNWIDGLLTIGEYGMELAIAQALADIEAPLLAEIERLKHQLDDALSRADREEFRANMADPLFRPGDV